MNMCAFRNLIGLVILSLTCAAVSWLGPPAIAASVEPQSEQFSRGESFFQNLQYLDAVAEYREAAKVEPDNARVHQRLGAALAALQRYDEAIEAEKAATRFDPSSSLPHIVLGQIYTNQGRMNDALSEFKTARQLDPKNLKAQLNIGYVLMQVGQLQESLKAYQIAAQIKPDDPKPYLNMALVLGLLGDKKGSIAASQKAIEVSPKESHAYVTLANTYLETGDVARAIDSFNKALVLDPKNLMATSGLGDAYRQQGKLSDAIFQQQEALKVSPEFTVARVRLAEYLDAVGDRNGADREYQEAVRQSPKDAGVLCGYGLLLERQGNRPGAVEYFKKALAANPHWKIARARLDKLAPGTQIASRSLPDSGATSGGAAASATISGFGIPSATSSSVTSQPRSSTATSSTALSNTNVSIVNQPVKDKWALVIGISKFQNPAYNLKYAAKDAQDFFNFLIKEANFRPDHVKLLVNEQATRKNIMAAFGSRWLPSVVEPGDLAVVYVSTHGTPASSDNESKNYIVAYDTEADDPYSSGVDMDEVYRRIKDGVKTDRALIVLDTCYSGGAVPEGKGLVRCDNFDLRKVQLGSGHLIVSSSNTGERSWESKRYENGVFTHNLIEALRVNGTKVNIPEAFKQMQDKVRWEVKCDYGAQQSPQLGGNWSGAELILSVVPKDPRMVAPSSSAPLASAASGTTDSSTLSKAADAAGKAASTKPGPVPAKTIPAKP
jgi:tetratricopeptide (TPR) repeat protein